MRKARPLIFRLFCLLFVLMAVMPGPAQKDCRPQMAEIRQN